MCLKIRASQENPRMLQTRTRANRPANLKIKTFEKTTPFLNNSSHSTNSAKWRSSRNRSNYNTPTMLHRERRKLCKWCCNIDITISWNWEECSTLLGSLLSCTILARNKLMLLELRRLSGCPSRFRNCLFWKFRGVWRREICLRNWLRNMVSLSHKPRSSLPSRSSMSILTA